jgi:sulfite exporter TauE/SafE
MIELWAAISLGLVSSLHCAGMCGPIAFALPLDRSSWLAKSTGAVVYNGGRVLTYATMGGLFGLLGKAFFTAGFQRGLSIGVGVFFLVAVIVPMITKEGLFLEKWGFQFIGRFKGIFQKQFKKRNAGALLTIGAINGLLPCGMVYLGLAGSVATGTFSDGFLFMVFFGLGTLPMMLAASLLSDMLSVSVRSKMRKAVPYFIAVMGILFILRGMNLGIHYLSPQIDRVEPSITACD